MRTLSLALSGQPCSIEIGEGIPSLPENVAKAVLVTDENVLRIYGKEIEALLKGRDAAVASFPAGERSKSKESLFALYDAFLKHSLARSSHVIAFGGGVVGDLAAFAASTFMRGIKLIQMPTTLLAQVDSSVGGKTAINYGGQKNIVGSFYQPEKVLISTDFLSTLDDRQRRAGMAEAVKYAFIHDPSMAECLGSAEETVWRSCSAKAAIVAQDERDTGKRMALNFGHTFGHAIERLSFFGKYAHGEAVAMGMRLALRFGRAVGLGDASLEEALDSLLAAHSYSPPYPGPVSSLLPFMGGDKKNAGDGSLSLILLEKMGSPLLYRASRNELEKIFGGA
jgi:3-dehydroquinate synthase